MKKAIKIAAIIMYSALIYACVNNDRKNDAIQMMNDWIGKKVVYPDTMKFYKYGIDNIDYKVNISDYKIITYVDSIGCKSCKLQFPEWKEIVKELDSVKSASVQVLFFVTVSNREELNYIMLRDNFTHPVCLDEEDSFNKLNKISTDIAFQTFLLDKESKVIAIGNPVHNPKVKELYLNIILGDKAPKKEDKTQTTIACSNTNIDLSKFDWKKKQTARFTLENTGNSPLAIVDVTTSCGCTSVEYPKEPVRAGKSVEIKVHYQAEQPEYFNKTITVHCNSAASPIKLAIKGNADETSS